MKRVRFEQAKPGSVIEFKGEHYIKLAHCIKKMKVHSLPYNAVTMNGELFNFFPYEEVSEVGPFWQEKK